MAHLVLLGDSIFDNGVYVPGHPDVVRQVRAALPAGWTATLLAVDGAVIRSVPAQLARIPSDATHLAVSVGGNDALGASGVLGARADTVAEAVGMLAQVQAGFAGEYSEMAAQVAALGLPTALCTIYDTRAMEPDHRIIKAALALFNDVITRTAFRLAMPLVDLRLICSEDADYANPIEPSAAGGEKIARALARFAAGESGSAVIAD